MNKIGKSSFCGCFPEEADQSDRTPQKPHRYADLYEIALPEMSISMTKSSY